MNAQVLEGKWKQIVGEAKKRWGKLTDNDLKVIEGHQEKLVGLLQEKYGYARDKAEKEVDLFMREFK